MKIIPTPPPENIKFRGFLTKRLTTCAQPVKGMSVLRARVKNHLHSDGLSDGFSLVELMIGLTLSLILTVAIISVYLAQKNIYKTNSAQASIQNAESAIAALVTPTIRAAGFSGCTTVLQALSNLNAGGPAPLGALSTTASMVMGYGSTASSPITITDDNATNSATATNWSPSLDASLTGHVEAVSDVLVVLGPVPGSQPIGVTTFTAGANSLVLQNSTGISVGQFAAVSDCLKASIFTITAVAGTTVTHEAGAGALANANAALAVNYPAGSQFVTLTQTAFFVASDPSGQSSLVKASLNTNGTWTFQSLVPGVETMKVLYGIGANGSLTQYVEANAVVNWGQIYAIRIGFLIEGQQGSSTLPPTQFSVLGTTVNVPADNRLRHVFEMTINIRNSAS